MMLTSKLWLPSLMALSFAFLGLSDAHAAKKAKAETLTLKISNLTNDTKAKEVKKLEKAVKKVKGVTKVAVSKKKGEITIKHTAVATADAIKAAVAKAGFAVVNPAADVEGDDSVPADEPTDDPEE